jgi:formate C-acetyltransferase
VSARAQNKHILACLRRQTAAEITPELAPAQREAECFAGTLERLPIFHNSGDLLAGDYGWRPEDDARLHQQFPQAEPTAGNGQAMTPRQRLNVEFHCFGGYSPAHTCIDYGKLLRLGVDGLLLEIETAGATPYRQAMATTLNGLVALSDRYAELLEQHQEPALAEICRRVPRRPASTFHEALQSIWFAHLAIPISEYNDASISLGRLDQYAYPYYCNSLEAGCPEIELERQLAALLDKLNRYGDAACNLNLGGLDAHDQDLCNPLTRMIIRVAKAKRQPSPILAARIHPNFPRDIFDSLIDPDLFAIGQPTFYGELPCREALRERGVAAADLPRWAASSCMAPVIEGAEVSNMWGGVITFLLPLELTVNNGQPFHKTLPVPLQTAPVSNFKSFDELFETFLSYLGDVTALSIAACREATRATEQERPNPFISALLDSCIKRGCDRLAGGVDYHTAIFECFGLVNAADALLTIKTLVFEQKVCSLAELVKAAKENFQGYEQLLRQIKDLPKYGAGEPEPDGFAARLADAFQRLVRAHSIPAHVCAPSFHTLGGHVSAGAKYGASLDGRLSGRPLAKNIGSTPRAATADLTARIRSATAIAQKTFFGGQALDLSVDASLVKSLSEKRKFQALLQTYFDLGGMQIQVNGLQAEKLRQAIDNPDEHQDLIVRIGGYSDYFNNLSLDARHDMARRFEHGL